MAVRESWCLAIAWRKSSVSNTDESCVQVAVCETTLESYDEHALSSGPPRDRG